MSVKILNTNLNQLDSLRVFIYLCLWKPNLINIRNIYCLYNTLFILLQVEAVGYHSKIVSFTVHDNKSKYPKLTTLRIELQDSSVYTTPEEITTEKMLKQEETTKSITKTYTRVSPKLSNRFGVLKEESEANIVPLEVKLNGAIKSIIDAIILFNCSFILLLR